MPYIVARQLGLQRSNVETHTFIEYVAHHLILVVNEYLVYRMNKTVAGSGDKACVAFVHLCKFSDLYDAHIRVVAHLKIIWNLALGIVQVDVQSIGGA